MAQKIQLIQAPSKITRNFKKTNRENFENILGLIFGPKENLSLKKNLIPENSAPHLNPQHKIAGDVLFKTINKALHLY